MIKDMLKLRAMCGGGSGSGLPSGGAPYQQLVTDGEGKTVWEDRLAYSEEGVTIEWDGNKTGLESHTISLMGQQFLTWYVSDAVIDRANRDGLRVTFADGEEEILTEGDYYAELDTDEYYVIAEEAFMVEKAGAFPSRGVWFMDRTSPNLLKIEEPATIKRIDNKYIPEGVVITNKGGEYSLNCDYATFKDHIFSGRGIPVMYEKDYDSWRFLTRVSLADDGSFILRESGLEGDFWEVHTDGSVILGTLS